MAVPRSHVRPRVVAPRTPRGEVGHAEGLFAEDAEEAFDLIEPRRAREGVMEGHARVLGEPGADLGRACDEELSTMTWSS